MDALGLGKQLVECRAAGSWNAGSGGRRGGDAVESRELWP